MPLILVTYSFHNWKPVSPTHFHPIQCNFNEDATGVFYETWANWFLNLYGKVISKKSQKTSEKKMRDFK